MWNDTVQKYATTILTVIKSARITEANFFTTTLPFVTTSKLDISKPTIPVLRRFVNKQIVNKKNMFYLHIFQFADYVRE
ncbi:MAG: hypothetical protein ACOYJX_00680 [Acutalibacteraceae bacterium]